MGHEWAAVVYSRTRGSGCPYCYKLKSSDDGYLVVSNSSLRLEWHPTANGKLTPKNLTISYPEKVWWICREGHKWKATVRARLKGEGCPVCGNSVVKTLQLQNGMGIPDLSFVRGSNFTSEIGPLDTIFGADFRKSKRFKGKATVKLVIPSSEHLFYAQMKDFSRDGMCVETSTSIRPGTKLNINLARPLFTSSRKSYDAVIRWCKGLTDGYGVIYSFGVGVQFT